MGMEARVNRLTLFLFIGFLATSVSTSVFVGRALHWREVARREDVRIVQCKLDYDVLSGDYRNLQGVNEALGEYIEELEGNIEKLAVLQPAVGSFTDIDLVDLASQYEASNPFQKDFKVTSRFGESTGFGYRRKHLGTDLSVYGGDRSIYPMWDGEVADIGISDIYGKWILIKHDENVYTKYCHLETIFYSALPGEHVTKETRIGIEGSTGHSTAAHLHLELRIRNPEANELVPIDIYPFLEKVGER